MIPSLKFNILFLTLLSLAYSSDDFRRCWDSSDAAYCDVYPYYLNKI